MAKTLLDCMLAIQDIVGRVEGIRSAPEFITDKIPQGIFSLVFPDTGEYRASGGVLEGYHNIGLYVFCPRGDLAKTLKAIIPLGDKVAAALENEPRLLDTCNCFGTPGGITYTFSFSMNVGKPEAPAYVTGWTFMINNVKIHNEDSLA